MHHRRNMQQYLSMAEQLNQEGAMCFANGDAHQALQSFKKSTRSLSKLQHHLAVADGRSTRSSASLRLMTVPFAPTSKNAALHEHHDFVFARALVLVHDRSNQMDMDDNSDDDDLRHQWSLSSAMVMFNVALASHVLWLQPGQRAAHRHENPLKQYAKCMRQWKAVTPLLSDRMTSEHDAVLVSLVSMATLNNMAQLWTQVGEFDRAHQAMGGVLELVQHLSADFAECFAEQKIDDGQKLLDEFLVNALVTRSCRGRGAAAA